MAENGMVPGPHTNGSGGGNGTNGANGSGSYHDPRYGIRERRIKEMGKLSADTGFIDNDDFDEWKENNSIEGKFVYGPERTGDLICHAADMFFFYKRKLNLEELKWTYTAMYGTTPFKCDNFAFLHVCNYCSHEESLRMQDEWIARLPHHKSATAIWVMRRKEEGKPTAIVRSDPKLFPPVAKARATTGNTEVDGATAKIGSEQNRIGMKMLTRYRPMMEQEQALLDLTTYEVRAEVTEKNTLKGDVLQLQSQMAEVLKRLPATK